MKEICFFCGDISRRGGTERVTLHIANELADKDDSVTILSLCNGEVAGFACSEKIELRSLHTERYNKYYNYINAYRLLFLHLKQYSYDILINVDVILCLYTLPMKKIFGMRIVAWEHFNYFVDLRRKKRKLARILAAQFADYIIVLTKKDLGFWKKNLNIKVPITQIYNPVISISGDEIENGIRKNQIMACGRLTFQKNFDDLLLIWREILSETEGWSLIICGDGEDKEKLLKMKDDLELYNVDFIGNSSCVEKYYRESKILAVSSRFEGFPMVILEAMQEGLPVVSFDCPTGPSEIIDGRNGCLIGMGDYKEFGDKLLMLMQDESKREEMSCYARKSTKRFDMEVIIKRWENLIEELSYEEAHGERRI